MRQLARSPRPDAGARAMLAADDAQGASWLLMARPLMILWLVGGGAVELWLALYGGHATEPGLVLAVAVASQVVGVVVGLSARRTPPPWAGHAILLSAAVAVSLALWGTRDVSNGFELIYLWPAPYAFILVRPRAAVLHVGLVGSAWIAYLSVDATRPDTGRWLVSIATLVAIALVSAHLVRSLRGSHRLLNSAFEEAPLGMAFMDVRGRWIALNGALRTMLGRTDDELCGTPVSDLLAVDERGPQALRTSAGAELWVEVTRAAVNAGDRRVACWSLQVSDVTERLEAEHAMRRDAEQARWADEVRAALEEDRIALYVQPLVALDGDRHAGHELLARLVQADGTVVAPGAFMPAVERFGLAPDFDTHVIRRAVDVVATGRPLHVNLSAHSVGRPEVVAALRNALLATGADPGLLTLEITETALTDDVDAFSLFGRELCELGCRLALDDFGTGYGTLTYLTSLPFSEIKIDREFVRGLTTDAASAEIVRAVVALARSLGTTTVAEGVEDEQTLALVRRLGVDVAQGYLFGRPGPIEDAFSVQWAEELRHAA